VSEKKIETVRFIGYLLETNGTTGAIARGKDGSAVVEDCEQACKWCLHGARYVAVNRLNLQFIYGLITANYWDNLSDEERKSYINKLKNYDGTQDLSCV